MILLISVLWPLWVIALLRSRQVIFDLWKIELGVRQVIIGHHMQAWILSTSNVSLQVLEHFELRRRYTLPPLVGLITGSMFMHFAIQCLHSCIPRPLAVVKAVDQTPAGSKMRSTRRSYSAMKSVTPSECRSHNGPHPCITPFNVISFSHRWLPQQPFLPPL